MCSLEREGRPRHQALHRAGPQIGIGLNKLQLGCAPNVPLAQHPRLPHHPHVLARLDLHTATDSLGSVELRGIDLQVRKAQLTMQPEVQLQGRLQLARHAARTEGYGWHAARE